LDRVNGAERFRVEAFPGFAGGAQVAVGDVTGDGVLDIIAAPGSGHSPQIRVFDGTTGNVAQEFLAYNAAFAGGVFIAVANFNGDNRADIVTAPLGNGGPHVRIFSGAGGVSSGRVRQRRLPRRCVDGRWRGRRSARAGVQRSDGRGAVRLLCLFAGLRRRRTRGRG
jgi:hypothetical protein